MITFVFGAPGSGKSYYSVSEIAKNLVKRYVVTNIQLTDTVVSDNYIYLDFDNMKHLFTNTEDVITGDFSIEEKVDLLQDVYPAGTLLVIDEAHLFGFGERKNEYLRDFLSIHRHIHIDVIIVTQTPRALRSDILDLGELFIAVQPASKRIAGMLEYTGHSTYSDFKRDDPKMRIMQTRVFPNKDIFALYKSGENHKGSKKFFFKVLQYAAIVLIAVGFATYNVNKLVNKPPVITEIANAKEKVVNFVDKNNTKIATKSIKKRISPKFLFENYKKKVKKVVKSTKEDLGLKCYFIFSKVMPDWRSFNMVRQTNKKNRYEVCTVNK